MTIRLLSWAYLAAAFVFVYLPVAVLVAFSFQDGRLPVPPLKGFTLDWYAKVLGNDDLTAALLNSLLVALVSSLIALILGRGGCGNLNSRDKWIFRAMAA